MNIWTKTGGFGVFFQTNSHGNGYPSRLKAQAPQMDLSCFSLNHYWGTTCRDIHVATWMFDQHVLGFISIQWPFLHMFTHFYYNNKGYISYIQPPFLSSLKFITHFSDQWPSQGRVAWKLVALKGCRKIATQWDDPNFLVNDPAW